MLPYYTYTDEKILFLKKTYKMRIFAQFISIKLIAIKVSFNKKSMHSKLSLFSDGVL